MNVLISGGAKNGKSFFAQRLARQMAVSPDRSLVRPLYYIATMIPADEEDRARIQRHVADRDGWGFETLEHGRDLLGLLDQADVDGLAGCVQDAAISRADPAGRTSVDPAGVFLLDSVTALLSNEMFGADEAGNFRFDAEAPARVAADCAAFARRTGNTVFVSDTIYGDAGRYDPMTEDYRRGLGLVDRRLAAVCDWVIEVSAGTVEVWKSPIGDSNANETDSRISDGLGMLLLDPLPL